MLLLLLFYCCVEVVIGVRLVFIEVRILLKIGGLLLIVRRIGLRGVERDSFFCFGLFLTMENFSLFIEFM